jgi:plasmid maintenance system antidote protein VapI
MAQAFGTSPEYWMNLQTAFDLHGCAPRVKKLEIKRLPKKLTKKERHARRL